MAPKTVEGGQIWLKCITGDLIMMIRDKNNIFERVENFHADLAWNYPTFELTRSAASHGHIDQVSTTGVTDGQTRETMIRLGSNEMCVT